MDEIVIETLRQAQRFGFFGARPIEEAIDHSMAFVDAMGNVAPGCRIADIGSGGGLPGLVIGAACPQATITLIDRRQKRTDFLRRAIMRLGWQHVTVIDVDVADVITDVAEGRIGGFDVVTARGFGPPDLTLRMALGLLNRAGSVIISEPPTGDRWDPTILEGLAVVSESAGPVRVFRRIDDVAPTV